MNTLKFVVVVAVAASLAACGGGGGASSTSGSTGTSGSQTTYYTVGGTVSGLNGSATVALSLNGGTAISAGNQSFAFTPNMASGASYSVAVATQPSGEICTVSNGSGTIGSASVANVLVSCFVPFNSSVATPSYDQASFEYAFFERLNTVRAAAGLGLLAQNTSLDTASRAHALYDAVNFDPATMSGIDPSTGQLYGHSEDVGMPDFYASTVSARDTKAGYTLGGSGEVAGTAWANTAQNGTESLRTLMNTVYHRTELLSDAYDYVGIGADPSGNSHETNGWYVADLGRVSNGQTLAVGTSVVYPVDGSTDAVAYFNNALESPSPLPSLGNQGLGSPISLQITSADTLLVTSFTLTDSNNTPVAVVLSDAKTDISGFMPSNVAFIVPTAPLIPGETYTASFTGSDGNTAISKTWHFTTAGAITVLTQGPYVVHNGGSLVVAASVPSSQMTSTFSTPLSGSQVSYVPQGPEGFAINIPANAVNSPATIQVTLSDTEFSSVNPVTLTVTVEP